MFARSFLGIPDADPAPLDGYVAAWSAGVGRALWKPITGALLSGFAAGLVAFGAAGGAAGTGLTTSAGLSYDGTNLSIGTASAAGGIGVNGPAGSSRDLFWSTAGVVRWLVRTDGTAEGGANAGSDFNIIARTDAGGTVDTPFKIARTGGGDIGLTRQLVITPVSAAVNCGIKFVDTNASGRTIGVSSGAVAAGRLSIYDYTGGGERFSIDSAGTVKLYAGVASSSTTTGTEVITGGLGVSGDVYIGATLNAAGNIACTANTISVTRSTAGGTFLIARNDDTTSATAVEIDVQGTTTGGAGRSAVRIIHQANQGAGNAAYLLQSGKVSAILFEDAATVINQREGGPIVFGVNDAEIARIDSASINLFSGKVLKVNGTQVVAARDTGWTAMTGSPDKATAYATSTVTLAQLAGRVAQLQASMTTHGLIGP